MNMIRHVTLAVAVLWLAAPAAAQSVQLQFDNGQVTLIAQNASPRTILAEWARLGGTKVVNGGGVPGGPLTLELRGVPERDVLDILLRSASGYMVGPRRAGLAAGGSSYDSILILPTSTAPRVPSPSFTATMPAPPVFAPPVRRIAPDPDDPEENPPDDIAPQPDPEDRPVTRPAMRPPFRQFQPVQPDPVDEQPVPNTVPVPANPFGVSTGSARPGVITPVPQPQGQPQNLRPFGDPEP